MFINLFIPRLQQKDSSLKTIFEEENKLKIGRVK